MEGKDLAEHCIAFGQKLGGHYVEARFVEETARGIVTRNGAPVAGGTAPSTGIGVRILVDGNMGFASFDRLEKSIAEEAITAAYKMAKAAKREHKISLGEEVTNEAKWSVDLKERIADVDIDTIMKTAEEFNEQMSGLAQYTMIFNPYETEKYLTTSEGTKIEGFNSHISMTFILVASGKAGAEQRVVDLTQCGGWERIKEGRVVEKLADEVERLKKYANNAVNVPELMGQPIDMVVGQEVAGIISHENVGHPSEGDRISGREGAQAGESFWRDLRIGESRVGSEAVSIGEDPTIPNTAGFYLYDDEGVMARKRTLVKNGILHEPLLNREFGSRFGMNSNGAARAVAYNREPIIRMANTFVEPGDHSFEELVEDIKLGVYMRSFMEWNIDDRRYQSKYSGAESYLIKDGEIKDTMVKRPVLETTSVGLLSAIDAVSKNLSMDFAATCGKSDPMQGVPVAAGGGELRLRGIRLGGVG